MGKQLTAERLRELLHFDTCTGVFTWRVSVGRVSAGARAGTPHSGGYTTIAVDGQKFLAHRLAWLYVMGTWPTYELDHRDGDRAHNPIGNLREASHAENQQNRLEQARAGQQRIRAARRALAQRGQVLEGSNTGQRMYKRPGSVPYTGGGPRSLPRSEATASHIQPSSQKSNNRNLLK